jgi:hypothetical protein
LRIKSTRKVKHRFDPFAFAFLKKDKKTGHVVLGETCIESLSLLIFFSVFAETALLKFNEIKELMEAKHDN